ncbi:MAG: M20/M25/M40 family metallo-hydrolase [Vicinamibacterales bacterium]
MLGGHLDSWHAATGATDNAIGSATMLESIRILQAIGVRPRRTIRVALWSGEEQGLLGSQAYVKEHFGTAESPKPEYANFAGYFNIDSGTGRARGMTVFGPPAAATVLRDVLAPFADNGVIGATSTRSRARGGSESHVVQRGRTPGRRHPAGPHRIQLDDVAHEPGYVRARDRRRRAEVGDGDRRGGLSPRDAERAAASVHVRADAETARSLKRRSRASEAFASRCTHRFSSNRTLDRRELYLNEPAVMRVTAAHAAVT